MRFGSPDPETPHAGRLAPVLGLGAPVVIGATLLAVFADSAFWLLVLACVLVIAAVLLTVLARAIRPAMRPQHVTYDHSWWTNLLGDTSTPHPGPAATRRQRSSPVRDGSSDRE
jgi:hypothetical protein